MTNVSDEREIRKDKVNKIRESGINPYVDRCDRTHSLSEARKLPVGTEGVTLAGRLMLKRVFGKLIFATIQDFEERMQIALNRKNIEQDDFLFFKKMIDVGDFVHAEGDIYETDKGELTLNVKKFTLLSKAIRPLPEKFHGVTDLETRSRQRYLDLIMDKSTRDRFMKRIELTKVIRNYLDENKFVEVETPVLQNKPSGALAKPFKTHHNALDIDMYMRIAPETYLKRCIAGGFERVYEFARCFRNEGMDPSHLQEFTILEYYCAFWNYEDNMKFTEELIKHILTKLYGTLEITYQGTKIDFSGNWPRYSFAELIMEHAGIDINQCPTKESLIKEVKAKNITLEGVEFNKIGRGNLIDQLYKKVARPKMINPQFLIHHPIDLSPLARKNDDNELITDRFQLVVNSWEIVNAYSELVDPVDQRERLIKQASDREKGDEEAMVMDEDFIACMEYGMPPISGWGMGIDRFISLLTNQENLREVVLFPIMKPLDNEKMTLSDDYTEIEKSDNAMNVESENSVYEPKDIADLKVGYDKLDALFDEKLKRDNMRYHCIASGAIMKAVAKHFGLNEMNFYYTGLMHDIDMEEVNDDMEKHATVGAGWLKDLGMDDEVTHAIMAHNAEGSKVERSSFLDYALTCSETISGMITAVAKVYPDKKVASVKVKSVTKRLKSPSFAANVSRERIALCEKIGLDLNKFIEIAIEGMKEYSEKIGL